MKKYSGLSLLLCCVLLVQLFSIPAFATESTSSTEAPYVQETAPAAEFGTATVLSGCRTIEGQVPLGGSDRILDTAQAAFIYERNTGTVIYSYNPDMALYPGTLAKLLAAIVAIENGNLSDEVTVSTRNYSSLPAGAVNAKLKEGEVLTLKDLLYCMVLEWANDAAISIAEHIAGSEAEFVKLMNDTAAAIGCTNSVFKNCHGLDTAGQEVTARDMVRIIEYATRNSDFMEMFAATSYTVAETNKSEKRGLKCLNYLVEETYVPKYNYDGVTGGIASYSSGAGASIACTAEDEDQGLSLIVVLLGSKRTFTDKGSVSNYGNYEEVWDLLDFALDGYRVCRLLHDGQSLSQFTVSNGENQVVGQSHTGMDAVLPIDAHLKNLILKYSVEGGGLTAPIAQDQKIATLQIWYRNSCVAETEVYAMSSVRSATDSELEIQDASRSDANLTGVLKFIGIVCLIILIPFVIYLVINNVRRTIARNRRRRRRRSRRRSR